MLFSSGVGYFEHTGTVRGDVRTELRFRTSQIDDILKSLVLRDQDGGHVTTITYPSQDPLVKTLRSFQVDITGNPSLASLLNQLRGARVTVQARSERLTGTILGVESRRKAVDKGEPIDSPVLNLLTGATIRAVELQSIGGLTLDDPQLQDELAKALTALSQARDQDKKPVTINFAGSGERRVRIGYVVETPVWKTSYRLLLGDKGATLQGWAIVENQTESDWNNVALSLVSGRPISFMMDLYQPMYASRPTVVPELYAGLRPQVYEGAMERERDSVAMAPAAPSVKGAASARRIGYDANGKPMALQLEQRLAANAPTESAGLTASIASSVPTEKLGALFQYTVGNVTLARQKSAMLPIIGDTVSVDRVSIYNASVLQTHPLNGVRLRNTTGKHLQQGPVTVLEKNSYAGDAQIDDVPPGQDRLLSYGIDLDVLVNSTLAIGASNVVTARIVKGVFNINRRSVSTREYDAENKGDKDKLLVIEHPIRYGWKLVDTQPPFETTPAVYRFQGNALAKKVTKLIVREEIVGSEQFSILTSDVGQLLSYTRMGEMPSAVRDALIRAAQLRQAVVEVERQIDERVKQAAAITQEQSRIRENMKTVDGKSQYYKRLLDKLNEQETLIEKLGQERNELTKKRDAQRKELDDYLSSLTVG
ncbi:MAG TPA: hypothetical protein VHE78_00700 [Gemmatimonadaceae bacterium]|nr:hypothetical protein [Gemmatimonadaceae bacterium]